MKTGGGFHSKGRSPGIGRYTEVLHTFVAACYMHISAQALVAVHYDLRPCEHGALEKNPLVV
jgi:hypothetical protein